MDIDISVCFPLFTMVEYTMLAPRMEAILNLGARPIPPGDTAHHVHQVSENTCCINSEFIISRN